MLGQKAARSGARIVLSTWREKTAQLRRLWRLPGATEAMHRATVEQYQAMHRNTEAHLDAMAERFNAIGKRLDAMGERFDSLSAS